MIGKILDILFPKICLNCGKKEGSYLCSSCFSVLDLDYKILPVQNKLYTNIIYLGKYKDDIRKKILNFKFYNKPYINEYFLEFLIKNKNICDFLKKFDLIIPVPMFKNKRLKRGYNQSEIFAKNLGKKLDIKFDNKVLVKYKENKTQSLLELNQRRKNVKDVFKIKDSYKIKEKNIILVDDIYTTGATVDSCSKILKKFGANRIVVLVISKSH